jgi:hypothetical protein
MREGNFLTRTPILPSLITQMLAKPMSLYMACALRLAHRQLGSKGFI